jgi:hypothetical protein
MGCNFRDLLRKFASPSKYVAAGRLEWRNRHAMYIAIPVESLK